MLPGVVTHPTFFFRSLLFLGTMFGYFNKMLKLQSIQNVNSHIH